jgi:flavin reductase (DIM6/NTAB) family NADH-FMN oxidoreductase RutF
VDEIAEAGLTTVPGEMVRSPRILEAPAALECRRTMTLEVGRAREIILGEVLGIFVREDLVDDRLHVDQHGMDAIGRLGGYSYARTRDQFEIKTQSVEEWESRKIRF